MKSSKIVRNNTSFPVQINTKLKDLYDKYKEELKNSENKWAHCLKYFQYLIREIMLNDTINEEEYSRGLLIYHSMGVGKTRLAVSIAVSCWDEYQPVVLLPQGLKKNFKENIKNVTKILNKATKKKDDTSVANTASIDAAIVDAAIAKFYFVSMDAYNSSKQMENVGINKNIEKKLKNKLKNKILFSKKGGNFDDDVFLKNGLDNKLLIIDEAHNFFRSIINSASNARKIYEMIMTAKNLKILFLTGTICSKDPFELVPCFNMLTGKNLLPTSYDIFYNLFVDKTTNSILNRNKLSNRLIGLVSHVSHDSHISHGSQDKQTASTNKTRQIGWFPECKSVIVSYLEMEPFQYKQYLLAREKEDAEKGRGKGSGSIDRYVNSKPLALPNSESKAMGSYYVKSRILSNFTPPREYIGKSIQNKTSDVSVVVLIAFHFHSHYLKIAYTFVM
jgi:hypothetical protein